MKISDTSALVLNWTSPALWKSQNAKEYFSRLDLSAGSELLALFDETEDYMHTQAVSNRKFFVRKCGVDFLEKNPHGQVVILAAGIAPLSVELASLYPESKVFDVDKFLMSDKEKYLGGVCPNIKFIECDITNIELLHEKLLENNWNRSEPMILIMEGIIYYLNRYDLEDILIFFAESNSVFACDFGIKPEFVNGNNRKYGTEVFRKIMEKVGLSSMYFYEPNNFLKLLKKAGFKLPVRYTMRDVQIERTGKPEPFDYEEPGWISCVRNS
ncbi:MAG: class I SAM-dependent methyltransferase [Bacteroidetes bacterium]|nr:class I SAM-dependent methyltransferase [Bacteroidota bacterium]